MSTDTTAVITHRIEDDQLPAPHEWVAVMGGDGALYAFVKASASGVALREAQRAARLMAVPA